ncbi:hypothetical protein RDWZM_009153 [Blomia tropicalis]|uniref:Uncharacterized protein n=1 Tax=Blomia tropicalis TaxID=40697 RepID=A0A9Q0M2H1_BLOTA|nr:hypothetical protein RDWZM_009153 [Blomia tropicalis]
MATTTNPVNTSVADHSGSVSTTMSMSSLFERVTNFRRSLIKNQQKKNKIRPSSGSFNLFKPSNSTSNIEKTLCTNVDTNGSHKKMLNNDSYLINEQMESSLTNANGYHGSTTADVDEDDEAKTSSNHNHSSIVVDEGDAIYGFTSSNMNQTSFRTRQRKQTSNIVCPSSTSPSPMFTSSSSCISLYETIDEVEPISIVDESTSGKSPPKQHQQPPPPPLPPTNGRQFQVNNAKFRTNSQNSRQLRIGSIHDYDWKHDLLLMGNRSHFYTQHNNTNESNNGPMIDHIEQSYAINSIGSRIYENVQIGSVISPFVGKQNRHQNHSHHQHNQHHHHPKRSDNRKLTKDSGYESASTLVSLTQLNTCTPLQSSPQPSTPLPSITSPMGNNPINTINQHLISQLTTVAVQHSRSDSIDSTISLDADQIQSPSPPIPKCLEDSTRKLHNLHPSPPSVEDDSRPPTPPVRYSSLPQNRTFHSRNHKSEATFTQLHHSPIKSNQNGQMKSHPKVSASSIPISTKYFHAKQDSWPIKPNKCVPSNGLKSKTTLETSLDDIINFDHQNDIQVTSPQPPLLPPPPPLPPKDKLNMKPPQEMAKTTNSNNSEIKAIQKRAVYEFYLRQKEKKEKEKKELNLNDSSGSIKNYSTKRSNCANINGILPLNSDLKECDRNLQEYLPFPTPPPPLSSSSPDRRPLSVEMVNNSELQQNDNFPPPPTPIAMDSPPFRPNPSCSLQINVENTVQMNSDLVSPSFPPPPTPIAQEASCDISVIDTPAKQMFFSVDLSILWPKIDFSRLFQDLPPPPVKESNLDSDLPEEEEEDNDEEEELISIEQNRERQQHLQWRLTNLCCEQKRIALELERNEQIVGQLVDARLSTLEPNSLVDQSKLKLLCNDMVTIVRLMVSIVQQLARHERLKVSGIKKRAAAVPDCNGTLENDNNNFFPNGNIDVPNDVVTNLDTVSHCYPQIKSNEKSTNKEEEEQVEEQKEATVEIGQNWQQKLTRLWSQLDEAKRLRDNIETRRTMFEQRISRKYPDIEKKAKVNRLNLFSNDSYLLNESDPFASTGLILSDDIDLTSLIRYYLNNKEDLLVQQEVGQLLYHDLKARIDGYNDRNESKCSNKIVK